MLRQIHTEFFTFIRTEKSVVEIIFIYIIEAIDIVHAKAILQSLLDTQATAYKLWGHSPDHMVIGEMSLMDCFQHRMKVEKRSSKKQDVTIIPIDRTQKKVYHIDLRQLENELKIFEKKDDDFLQLMKSILEPAVLL
ncbi:MAG: hypothetical protein KBB91_00570 [Candidatus Pacebacteria bacterium]|nr:hypothetical protein [Candidatus Paceibacterota bacterium]MBP9700835.1 hypothetical protein [Candidatus Paceibacterota bacterium]